MQCNCVGGGGGPPPPKKKKKKKKTTQQMVLYFLRALPPPNTITKKITLPHYHYLDYALYPSNNPQNLTFRIFLLSHNAAHPSINI
jgi:hypothetical protein